MICNDNGWRSQLNSCTSCCQIGVRNQKFPLLYCACLYAVYRHGVAQRGTLQQNRKLQFIVRILYWRSQLNTDTILYCVARSIEIINYNSHSYIYCYIFFPNTRLLLFNVAEWSSKVTTLTNATLTWTHENVMKSYLIAMLTIYHRLDNLRTLHYRIRCKIYVDYANKSQLYNKKQKTLPGQLTAKDFVQFEIFTRQS